ncbi:MAG: type II secretion system minor pseudopilin GspI [Pseudomonadota bacterium]
MANQQRNEAGFTLIEVLMAMAIFSLIGVASLKLAGTATQSAAQVAAKTEASIVAENALVDALLEPGTLTRGEEKRSVRNFEQTWQLRQSVEATGQANVLRIRIAATGQAPYAAAQAVGFKVLERQQ